MSVFASIDGNFETEQTILTATTPTDILTIDERGNYIISIHAAEVSGSGATVVLDIFDGTTAYKLTGTVTVAANGRFDYTYPFRVKRGWTLRATAGAANQLHITVNYLIVT